MGMRYSDQDADRITSARLNEWLGAHDMSTIELGRRAGVNKSTMYSMTSGKGGTSVAVLRKVCKAGGIDANWLLGLK